MKLEFFNRPKKSDEERNFLNFWNTGPLARAFGFHLNIKDYEHPFFTVTKIEEWHQGGGGSSAINGGIIAALCDYTVGMVGILNLPDGKKVTADLKIEFKAPLEGSNFKVVGGIEKIGSNLVIAIAEVFNQEDKLCARARGRVYSNGNTPLAI